MPYQASWNGTFPVVFNGGVGNESWLSGETNAYTMDGSAFCQAQIRYSCSGDVPTWKMLIGDPSVGPSGQLWYGEKVGGTPDGVYTKISGSSPGPATITLDIAGTGTTPLSGGIGCTS